MIPKSGHRFSDKIILKQVDANRRMNRTGLIITLAIAAVVGLVFGLFPRLDIAIARPFYSFIDIHKNTFSLRLRPDMMLVHLIALRAGFLMVVPAVVALVLKLILPRRRMLISGRAVVFLIATMVLGPGLLVNVALKDHWGRPRPIDIVQYGGTQHFVPWWDPRGDCPDNCSFVSGDVATAAWTLAPAALAPPQWRVLAYGAAFAFTAAMAAMRIIAGGHFFTDTVFAGVFTFLIIWLMYGLIYRWPRTRLDDDEIERAIARFSLACTAAVRWLFGRMGHEIAGPEDKSPDKTLERRRGWW